MRKTLFGALLLMASIGYGADVYQSTYSATSNFNRSLCAAGERAYLHRVCRVDAVAASTAAVFNSSWTVSSQNLTGVMDASEAGCIDIQARAPNGLYTNQFGTAGIQIQFDCYR